jgi:hypothetical protein
MNDRLDINPDVLAIAVAMLSNPEAFKQATRIIEHECQITTTPVDKVVEWSLAIASGLDKGQYKLAR